MVEQRTTEQVHRGNIQGTPCFLGPRRGRCCEGQTTAANTSGSAGLPKGTLLGVKAAYHLPLHICTLCRTDTDSYVSFLFMGFGLSLHSIYICTFLEAHQDLNPAELTHSPA